VLVIDDASTDQTAVTACEFGVRLIRLPKKSGPGIARNIGAASALGDYVLFIDSDVCVHPETLSRFVAAFREDSRIDAVFGSYDKQPRARNTLSQYKNLFHHFVHQQAGREACTFWSGCGAIKRLVFLSLGGFSPEYKRPCIEDIELGSRLVRSGGRVVLEKSIQVSHLKRWSLWGIVKSDVVDRAVPWTELMLREGTIPNDLNLKFSQRFCALVCCFFLASLIVGAWHWHGLLFLLVLLLMGIHWFDEWSSNGPIPVTAKIAAVAAAFGAAASIGVQFRIWALIPVCLLILVVLINARFYVFLVRERNVLFAASIVPLHVLYYLYSTISFAFGVGRHVLTSWRRCDHPYPAFRVLRTKP
jgi:glycosyltransferase involved in cell wall biosynthesis